MSIETDQVKIIDERLDALKGYLIICVVIGHFTPLIFGKNSNGSLGMILLFKIMDYMNVYFYHIPLFFAVSAINVKSFSRAFLIKLTLSILLPYAIWFFRPSIIYNPVEDIRIIIKKAPAFLMGNFTYIQSVIWFLPALFTSNLIISLFRKNKFLINDKRILVILLSLWILYFHLIDVIAVVHYKGYIPFGIDVAAYLLPFCLGLSWVYKNEQRLLQRINKFVIISFILTGVFLIRNFEPGKTHSPWHHIIDLAQLSVPTTYLGLLGFIILITSILLLFLAIKPIPLLVKIGKYSFPIFLLHYAVMVSFGSYVERKFGVFIHSDLSIFPNLLLLVVSVALPVLLSKKLMKISNKFRYAGFVE